MRNLIGLLASVLFLAVVAAARAGDWQQLEEEAGAYAAQLSSSAERFDRASAATLMRAAKILSKKGQCRLAVDLREQALSLGYPQSFASWRALAKDAACARKWRRASLAATLAVALAERPDEKAAVLARLGKALENRSGLADSWLSAAASVYEQLLRIAPSPTIQRRLERLSAALASSKRLSVDRIYEHESGTPGSCIDFSRKMPGVDEIHYEDYIVVEPRAEVVYKTRFSDEVCVYGLDHGRHYQVRVRAGLRAANGERLAEDANLEIDISHRPPAVWFDRSAYVLPGGGRSQLLLYSINTDRVKLKLLRIHERNLLAPWVQRHFQRNLSVEELAEASEMLGEVVWEGEAKLQNRPDKTNRTVLSLPREKMKKPGLYILSATNHHVEAISQAEALMFERDAFTASQWLVVTDIGLAAYHAADGLLVEARSLSSGRPLRDVELVLYARGNLPLATMKTDERGLVRFAPGLLRGKGAREAVQVVASGAGLGLSLLSLKHPPLDLSDRGISGRPVSGEMNLFTWTERGVYRPGEPVHAVALLRDGQGVAVQGLPLTLRLTNPQGNPVLERVVKPGAAGDYVVTLPLPVASRTGRWRLSWYLEADAPALGEAAFLVEAFNPPRMEVSLQTDGVLVPGRPFTARLQADYLFGAPADGRPVTAGLWLEADPNPFPAYKGYRFLPEKSEVGDEPLELSGVKTDAGGRATLALKLESAPKARFPLRARLRAEVADVDGRIVSAVTRIPLRHLPYYLGIAPDFENGRVAAGAEASFRIIALDHQGRRRPVRELNWRLVAVHKDYQWFYKNGEWGYEAVETEQVRHQGAVALDGRGPHRLTVRVEAGRYRLEVFDKKRNILTSFAFQAGEQRASRADVPDAVTLKLSKSSYKPGEMVRLNVESPFPGSATLVVATDRIHEVRHFDLPDGRAELSLRADQAWGAGAYALVSVYRPGKEGAGRISRAVGVIWMSLERRSKRLELSIDTPEVTRPRRLLTVPVRVEGHAPGELVWLTLAAVDEAVLRLTDYRTPDPFDYYFGKRRLATELRDLYGRIVHVPDERPGRLRNGAGASGRRGMPESNIRVISLFSGRVEMDERGRAEVELPLPDFNGRLRLMAVAWSRTRLGVAEKPLRVTDPLVVSASLPRFMTVGDHSRVTLLLRNMEAPEGRYRIELSAGESVALGGGAGLAEVALKQGEKRVLSFPVQARDPGNGYLSLVVSGPDGYRYESRLTLGVRAPALPVVRRLYRRLEPGGKMVLDGALLDEFYRRSARLEVQLAATPGLDVAGLLAELERYPYGCLEQLTSRAYPLLFFNELASRWGLPADPGVDRAVESAVRRILEKQQPEGGFGLWSGYGDVARWASLYALEFLLEARRMGVEVPEYFLERGLKWVERDLLAEAGSASPNREAEWLAVQAYGHYVLALAGRAKVEELRYFYGTALHKLPTRLAAAQLGAALAMYGQAGQAKAAFARALASWPRRLDWEDYGSPLRDLAAVIALLHRAGPEYGDEAPLIHELVNRQARRQWLSTQEKAWMVLAARGVPRSAEITYRLDGGPDVRVEHRALRFRPGDLEQVHVIENSGSRPIWITLMQEGAPKKPPAPADNGFSLTRSFYTLDGKKIDGGRLKQGQMVVVVLEGRVTDGAHHPALLVDPFPAGLEAENPRLRGGMKVEKIGWLPALSRTRYVDVLDDRFVAALDVEGGWKRDARFTVAYLARATTPGRYRWPDAEVEDMYKPHLRARSGQSTLVVGP